MTDSDPRELRRNYQLLPFKWRSGWASGNTAMRTLAAMAAFTFPLAEVTSQPSRNAPTTVGQSRAAVVVLDDPRAEVLSILFHLAGAGEYNGGVNKWYLHQLDSAFAPYKDHPAVAEVARLRKETGVGFEAVMSMAAHITDPVTFAERAPIDPATSSLSGRWRGAEARPFLKLAARFSKDANVPAFLKLAQPMYDSATVRMKRFVDANAHFEWLPPYFTGDSSGSFFLSPVVGNSGGAYAARFDDGPIHELHAYIGIGDSDAEGFPVIAPDILPTIVHEFTHSYVNDVVNARGGELKESAARVFASAQLAMSSQAYSSPGSMLNESIVRAAVVRYVLANDGPVAAAREMREQQGRGFVWMHELAPLLGEYEKDRKQYPTFAAFMPRVIAYYNGLAPRIDAMTREFNSHRPSVVSTSIADGAVIDASVTEFSALFTRALADGPSFARVDSVEFPDVTSYEFSTDKLSFTLHVKLKPNTAYGLRFTGNIFSSVDGYPLNELTVRFRTR